MKTPIEKKQEVIVINFYITSVSFNETLVTSSVSNCQKLNSFRISVLMKYS